MLNPDILMDYFLIKSIHCFDIDYPFRCPVGNDDDEFFSESFPYKGIAAH